METKAEYNAIVQPEPIEIRCDCGAYFGNWIKVGGHDRIQMYIGDKLGEDDDGPNLVWMEVMVQSSPWTE